MPHSTSPNPDALHTPRARAPSISSHAQPFKHASDTPTHTEKFPDYYSPHHGHPAGRTLSPLSQNGHAQGPPSAMDRWLPRQERAGDIQWSSRRAGGGHARQKSLTEAFRTIRTRKASVSQNAHEIADALKAPISPKLIALCTVWYIFSALTNTSSKSILNAFPKPGTLTMIQFFMVPGFCLAFSWLASVFPSLKLHVPELRHGIRSPSRDIILTTLPLAAFTVVGHLLSATATSRIPVSTVHTIKGLSPLFTVAAYRLFFKTPYGLFTYLSLIPLTVGVMLACSAEFRGNILGILFAFVATIIFVCQNIYSKSLFNRADRAEADGLTHKLDKINLMCYSSGLAFLLTTPYWFLTEGFGLVSDFFKDGSLDLNDHPQAFDHGRLALEFIFNGTFHFGQMIMSFIILSTITPVSYSVASLIKRVVVVVFAIVWFQNPTTNLQAFGIALTFAGLYFYDRASANDKEANRKVKMLGMKQESLLPLNTRQASGTVSGGPVFESPANIQPSPYPYTNGAFTPNPEDTKKSDDAGKGRARGQSNATWLPAGTKQEETWKMRDGVVNGNVNGGPSS